MRDEIWQRAIDCAAQQFEGYVRQGKIETPAQRRAALDDAFQHAFGIIELAKMKGDTRDANR